MAYNRDVTIKLGSTALSGSLTVADDSDALVIFAHGSGSSRLSPRNKYVANELNDSGISTLLFDLLTVEEEKLDAVTGQFRFNIPLLSQRLLAATAWAVRNDDTKLMNIGYFGASTGAAAAIAAAAELPRTVAALVSRGGRPDLAGPALAAVTCPSLFIVGQADDAVVELNKSAMHQMRCLNKLELIPGATHLFEEPGTLASVAETAARWFSQYLRPASQKGATNVS